MRKYSYALCGHENLSFPVVAFVFHYEIKLFMFQFLVCLEIENFFFLWLIFKIDNEVYYFKNKK